MTSTPRYVKVLNKEEIHNGYKYQLGKLNVLNRAFDATSDVNSCSKGGLYFCTPEHVANYFDYGDHIVEVRVPDNAKELGEKRWFFNARATAEEFGLSPMVLLEYNCTKGNEALLVFLEQYSQDMHVIADVLVREASQSSLESLVYRISTDLLSKFCENEQLRIKLLPPIAHYAKHHGSVLLKLVQLKDFQPHIFTVLQNLSIDVDDEANEIELLDQVINLIPIESIQQKVVEVLKRTRQNDLLEKLIPRLSPEQARQVLLIAFKKPEPESPPKKIVVKNEQEETKERVVLEGKALREHIETNMDAWIAEMRKANVEETTKVGVFRRISPLITDLLKWTRQAQDTTEKAWLAEKMFHMLSEGGHEKLGPKFVDTVSEKWAEFHLLPECKPWIMKYRSLYKGSLVYSMIKARVSNTDEVMKFLTRCGVEMKRDDLFVTLVKTLKDEKLEAKNLYDKEAMGQFKGWGQNAETGKSFLIVESTDLKRRDHIKDQLQIELPNHPLCVDEVMNCPIRFDGEDYDELELDIVQQ